MVTGDILALDTHFLALYNVEKLLMVQNIGEHKSKRGGVRCLVGVLCYTSPKLAGYIVNGYMVRYVYLVKK